MKKICKYLICSFLMICVMSSCSEWLSAVPNSQVRNDEQFGNEEGFQQALIGCYIGLTDRSLFGCNLSYLLPDVMSQQYEKFLFGSENVGFPFQSYDFGKRVAEEEINSAWTKLYNVISNCNNALFNIDSRKEVLHPISYNVIKGELLAIRAYSHFELLRLFGHPDLAQKSDKDKAVTIPYSLKSSKDYPLQNSYSTTVALIAEDLKNAIELLKSDPIIKDNDPELIKIINIDGFFDKRNMRINYYAARAILAQVYMWEGSNTSFVEAKKLLEDIVADNSRGNIFPFVNSGFEANFTMAEEHVFSLNVIKLREYSSKSFILNFAATTYSALYLADERAKELYDVSGTGAGDNRYTKLLYPYTNSELPTPSVVIPRKYEQLSNYPVTRENLVPLIRISEIYFMLAECIAKTTGDINAAKALLEEVRSNRGVVSDLPCTDLGSFMSELTKEYAREFLAEGQLYFLYKRLGKAAITKSDDTIEEMTLQKYMLPYPKDEIQSGRIQF